HVPLAPGEQSSSGEAFAAIEHKEVSANAPTWYSPAASGTLRWHDPSEPMARGTQDSGTACIATLSPATGPSARRPPGSQRTSRWFWQPRLQPSVAPSLHAMHGTSKLVGASRLTGSPPLENWRYAKRDSTQRVPATKIGPLRA